MARGQIRVLTGQTFERLTVMEMVPREFWRRPHAEWWCVCVCGNFVVREGVDLTTGHVKSCGCRQRDAGMATRFIGGAPRPERRGEKNPLWKGDDAGYVARHAWVYRHKLRTGVCSDCGRVGKTHFSNVDHQYRRVLEDYIERCPSCHQAYDRTLGAAA